MTEQEILEGNKLILDFMGLAHDIEGRVSFMYIIGEEFPLSLKICTQELVEQEVKDEIDEFGSNLEIETYSFHTSWDWLMPVLHKILDITFSDEDKETSDSSYFYAIRDCLPDIGSTYRAIIDFIKLYNTQKDA